MTADECIAAAWTFCAPKRKRDAEFPRGFWPDVARVAVAMYVQQTDQPELDFRPTMCVSGNSPEPKRSKKKLGYKAPFQSDFLGLKGLGGLVG